MKKIIDGILYDTESAECLGVYDELAGDDDFFFHEELYRTKNGRYFLYRTGGTYCLAAREPFVLLTESLARTWAELKISSEDYCRIFGMPVDG